MNINQFLISQDLQMIREINNLSQVELAKKINVSVSTIERWEKNETNITVSNREKIYSYAYTCNIEINRIKEQFYQEEYTNNQQIVLFHGAKNELQGIIDLNKSRVNNDFGQGFYCGERLEQSALFVSSFVNASIYILKFDNTNLNFLQFQVDQDWMLTIAYFRGRIEQYHHTDKIKKLISRLDGIDYIIAPIADNRMFQIIDSFIDGEITDEQCKHCLAATNLGSQYVFKTKKALGEIEILEHCYLCTIEKEMYVGKRMGDTKVSDDKVKIARKQYRGKGQYIDEILL